MEDITAQKMTIVQTYLNAVRSDDTASTEKALHEAMMNGMDEAEIATYLLRIDQKENRTKTVQPAVLKALMPLCEQTGINLKELFGTER